MKKFFHHVINLGISPTTNFTERKKSRIANGLAGMITLMGIVVMLVSMIFYPILLFLHLLNFSTILGGSLTLLFNFWQKQQVARLILILFFINSLSIFSLFLGENFGLEYNLFSVMIGILVLFDRKTYFIPLFILCASAFILVKAGFQYVIPIVLSEEIQGSYYLNLVFNFILCFWGLYIFKIEHLQYEKVIEQKNEELGLQKEEIQTTLDIVEQERQKSDNLLLNILPEETAQELKATGQATPKHYDLVSVLFTDFKGFTMAVENLKPIEVIQELDFCFNKFDEIVEKYGLERIKTIGDAYMAVGGLPVANVTNPTDAVRAGLEIQQFMNDLKQQREAEGKTAWQCRLGIHSGEVIAGVVGTKKFAYDIWGDTVNSASRMESSGEVGKVNISGTTYQLIKDKFQCEYRGKIEAKNKGEVEMYFVEGNV